jgi:hypothetical protein
VAAYDDAVLASVDVARQAHAALKEITRQDFGRRGSGDQDGRRRAVESWREWWDEQQAKGAKQKGAS